MHAERFYEICTEQGFKIHLCEKGVQKIEDLPFTKNQILNENT